MSLESSNSDAASQHMTPMLHHKTPSKRARLDYREIGSATPTARTPMHLDEATRLLREQTGLDAATSTPKRADYISWDDYFMAVASLSAHRSKDPVQPTGCCIVDPENHVIGIGYNGFPAGCADDCLPWKNVTSSSDQQEENWLHSPNPYVVHAEKNAVLNRCVAECRGARLYTQYFPCNECSKVIAQTDIVEVIYANDIQNETSSSHQASKLLLKLAGVRIRRYTPRQATIDLQFVKDPQTPVPVSYCTDTTTQSQQQSPHEHEPSSHAHQYRELLRKEIGYDPIATPSTQRRRHVLSWDDYFLGIAFLTAQRSKDPNTQVGACIVNPDTRHILGVGYNGFPMGCSDEVLPWSRQESNELHNKYVYVCHAEVNAILNKGQSNIRGATIYVALFPCNECAKMIIQAGIKEIVYLSDQYHDTEACRASRVMLTMAKVRMRLHIPALPSLRLHLQGAPLPSCVTGSESSNDTPKEE